MAAATKYRYTQNEPPNRQWPRHAGAAFQHVLGTPISHEGMLPTIELLLAAKQQPGRGRCWQMAQM
jgi:hypothetical protein